MTALQLWMLAGVLGMAGVACLVWYLAPAEPDLADVVGRRPLRRSAETAEPTTHSPSPTGSGCGWWDVHRQDG